MKSKFKWASVCLGLFLGIFLAFSGSSAYAAVETDNSCEQTSGFFGWVICPATQMVANLNDSITKVISDGFTWNILFEYDTINEVDGAESIFDDILALWSSFLPIANAIFAILFVIIIYSLVTSQGFSVYNIRKILPRLIVVAILINVSFYICALLSDVSNLIGFGLQNMMAGDNTASIGSLYNTLYGGGYPNINGLEAEIAINIMFFTFGIVVLGLILLFVAICARNIVLLLLILISPIALATILLPNTERWAKRWVNLYIQLLIIYPVFILIWTLAVRIQASLSSQSNAAVQIMGIFLPLIPVIMIVPLMKLSNNIITKASAAVQKSSLGTRFSRPERAKRDANRQDKPQIEKTNPRDTLIKLSSNTNDAGLKRRRSSRISATKKSDSPRRIDNNITNNQNNINQSSRTRTSSSSTTNSQTTDNFITNAATTNNTSTANTDITNNAAAPAADLSRNRLNRPTLDQNNVAGNQFSVDRHGTRRQADPTSRLRTFDASTTTPENANAPTRQRLQNQGSGNKNPFSQNKDQLIKNSLELKDKDGKDENRKWKKSDKVKLDIDSLNVKNADIENQAAMNSIIQNLSADNVAAAASANEEAFNEQTQTSDELAQDIAKYLGLDLSGFRELKDNNPGLFKSLIRYINANPSAANMITSADVRQFLADSGWLPRA